MLENVICHIAFMFIICLALLCCNIFRSTSVSFPTLKRDRIFKCKNINTNLLNFWGWCMFELLVEFEFQWNELNAQNSWFAKKKFKSNQTKISSMFFFAASFGYLAYFYSHPINDKCESGFKKESKKKLQ